MSESSLFSWAGFKTVALVILLGTVSLVVVYLAYDQTVNGDPFCIAGCASNTVEATYPFTLSLASQGQVFGAGDLRVGIYLKFNTTVIAGETIYIGARVVILPNADPRIRNGTVAVGIVIPSAQAGLGDTEHGIPSDFLLGLQRTENASDGSIIYGDTQPTFPISFPDQGDYRPYVIIQAYHYDSGLIPATNTLIHVEPRSMTQSIVSNRETRTFTYALLFFGLMDGLVLIPELVKGSTIDEAYTRHKQKSNK